MPLRAPARFEVREVEGEAAIPVDVLRAEDLPPEPAPAPTTAPETANPAKAATGAAALVDAGAPDVRTVDRSDAASDEATEGGAVDSGSALPMEAGGGSGPRDPEAIVGAAGAVQADVVLVMLLVNTEVIRKTPVGATLGLLLRGIPQWDDFMSGTDIDPVRDTDWLMISGPSLVRSDRDVVLIHYSAPDAVVDRAIAIVSRKYARGGPIDAGVPGVKAVLTHADRAERVMLRAGPRVLAVVPPSVASKVARQLVLSRVPPHVRPGEAMYLRLVNPNHPFPEIPAVITEARLRIVPRPDEGADVFVECDTKDAASAEQAASELSQVVRRHNDMITSLITRGLLDDVEVKAQGSGVKVHLTASRGQIETVIALVGGFLGVDLPMPDGG
jgi:hypothetical protein